MPGTDSNNADKFSFSIFPKFADFVLKNKLRDFIKEQLRLMFEVDFPVLKYYDLSKFTEEQLIELSLPAYTEFLEAAKNNTLGPHLTEAIKKWETNQLPQITKDQLVIEDITLAAYIRKKALLGFVPSYTSDVMLAIDLAKEIDDYIIETIARSLNTLLKIRDENLQEINEALKKQEAQLLEAQEIAGLGSFEWNLSGGPSKYTPQVFKIFEMEKTGNLSDFMDHVHPADREKLSEALKKAFAGDHYECEYRYRKNNKEKVIWSKGVITFEDGKPALMRGTIMGVTDRHHILKRLERNEELYKQSQQLTHIGNWTWDLETNMVNYSDELCRIYGLEPDNEITFERFVSQIHPEDKEKVICLLHHSAKTGEPHEIDFKIIRHNGSIRIIRRKVEVLKEKGVPFKVTGTGQDITKEVRLNKQIREREENFSQLIRNAPDGIIVIDENSKILLWNPKTTEIFGWSEEEAVGKDLIQTIIPERFREVHKREISHLVQTGNPMLLNKTTEVIAINKQGKEVYISLTISQSIQNSKPVFISFIRDITLDKKIKSELEEKTDQLAELNISLEQKNKALERSNKELTSFSYVASHDLQEPLRKIQTFSNLIMEREKQLSREGQEYFNRIIISAGRMQKLIEDLLSFSRTQLYENTLEPVDLNVVLNEIRTHYIEAINEERLSIHADNLPMIHGVQFQLLQLFGNIISNSIKYSKPGEPTEISITTEKLVADAVPFIAKKESGNYFKISLSDNGIGFDPQYSEKIFEIFQRLHGKNEYSGTGIGLSICKRIIENHHGYISANSKLNHGATFEIYLPDQLTVH